MPPEEAAGLLAQSGFEDLATPCGSQPGPPPGGGGGDLRPGQDGGADRGHCPVHDRPGAPATSSSPRLSEEKEGRPPGEVPLSLQPRGPSAVANPVERPLRGSIAVVSAGTSDLAVCEEAALTRRGAGGVRSTGSTTPEWRGSTASWRSWTPWSTPVRGGGGGYGGRPPQRGGGPGVLPGDRRAHQRGLRGPIRWAGGAAGHAQLLLQRISVVNIDNGFGAGYLASRINLMKGVDEA